MNVALVHYHLNRGGVTQVVVNHLLALDALPAHLVPALVVLCRGGGREGWPEDLAGRLRQFRLAECVIPELDYDTGDGIAARPVVLAERLRAALSKLGCSAENTVLHVHNHALGKNVSLPGAVCELASDGFPLLLQVHDFAEDFRPTNYRRLRAALSPRVPERLPELLYPQARHIHYAVLNSRDEAALRNAGMKAGQLHLLPNPVQPPGWSTDRSTGRARLAARFGIADDRRYVLYPVRGIRRKNLGEALLWSAVARSDVVFAFTLPPLNPLERPAYLRWVALAGELGLPCIFAAGEGHGLTIGENFAACDRVLTTSLAEGFGMVFLEGCLAQRPLVGRDLPEVTSDFVRRGITFAGLRSRIEVPVEWLGRRELVDILARAFDSTIRAYGREPPAEPTLKEGLESKLQNDCIDFGDLDVTLQERVLRTVCNDAQRRGLFLDLNPWLYEAVIDNDAEYFAESERNAIVVRSEYSLESTARRLSEIYQGVMTGPRQGPLGALPAGERVLDSFLSLSRFKPVRT